MNLYLLMVLILLSSPCLSTPITIESVYEEYRAKLSKPLTTDSDIINYLEGLKANNPKVYNQFMTTSSEEMGTGLKKEYPTYFAFVRNRASLFKYLIENEAGLSDDFFKNPKVTISPYFENNVLSEKFINLIHIALQKKSLLQSCINEFFSQLYLKSMPTHLEDYIETIKKLKSQATHLEEKEQQLGACKESLEFQDKLLEAGENQLKKKSYKLRACKESLKFQHNLGEQLEENNNQLRNIVEDRDLHLGLISNNLQLITQELYQVREKLEGKKQKIRVQAQQLFSKDSELEKILTLLRDNTSKFNKYKESWGFRIDAILQAQPSPRTQDPNLTPLRCQFEINENKGSEPLLMLITHRLPGKEQEKREPEKRIEDFVVSSMLGKQAPVSLSHHQKYFRKLLPGHYSRVSEENAKPRPSYAHPKLVPVLVGAIFQERMGQSGVSSIMGSQKQKGEASSLKPKDSLNQGREQKKQQVEYENKMLRQMNRELEQKLKEAERLNQAYQNEILQLKQGKKSLSTS